MREAAFGHPGAELLRRLAADRLPVQGELRTELERCFATFLLRHGFPVALVNHELLLRDPRQRVVLDAVWFEVGLAIELDGRQATRRREPSTPTESGTGAWRCSTGCTWSA